MVELTIDNKKVTVPEGTTILEAAKTAGLLIPNLCYLKGINEIGACRVCVVDVKGSHKLVTSCNTPVQPGMEVRTNTPRAREARRTNIELIMSQHKGHCIACARSGNCKLQTFTNNEYFERNSYVKEIPKENWSKIFPLYRDDTKCIKCMRCVQICDKIQSLGVWDVQNTGGRTTVGVSGNRTIEEANCSLCGQCVTHCPTGALRARNDCIRDFSVYGPISQEDKIKVVQIAPAVRAAWGEEFNLAPSFATAKRLVSVLKKIGFDYVFDTNFAADLTIIGRRKASSISFVYFLLSGLGSFCKDRISGYGWMSVHFKISATDVWCSFQDLFCRKTGSVTRSDLQCVHYAVYGKKSGKRY